MIRIMVDSSADFLPKEAQAMGIEILPISASIGELTYRDSIDMGRDEFYELLEETGEYPTTSQIPPLGFAEAFRKAVDAGDEVVALVLSSALSGTYQNALVAQAMVGNTGVYVVDSVSATYAIHIMAERACEMRDEGCSAEEIVEEVEGMKGSIRILAALDTLEYLQRGGRLPKTAAKVGEAAKLKPIITLNDNGTIGLVNACLGRKKALDAIMKQLAKYEIDYRYPVYSLYSYGTKNTEKLEERLQEAGVKITDRRQIGFVIGTHVGPNGYGVVFVERKDKRSEKRSLFRK